MNDSAVQRNAVLDLLRQVESLLREAASAPKVALQAVPSGPLSGTFDEAAEFLSHHEYELAWDALASLADTQGAASPVWFGLAQAGKLMGLDDRVASAVRSLAASLPSEPTRVRIVYQFRHRDAQGRDRWLRAKTFGYARDRIAPSLTHD